MEALARLVVQLSLVGAVVAGCTVLSPQPIVAATAAIVFVLFAVASNFTLDITRWIVLFLAYTSAGIALVFLPLFPGGALWLTALAGLVVGGFSWRRWQAPVPWRWPLMLWLLGVAVTWPVIALRETDFTLAAPSDGVGAVVAGTVAHLSAGLWLDTALSWDLKTIEQRVSRPLAIGVLVAAVALLYQGLIDITFLSHEPWISTRRAPGLMGDANPMAVAAALWAPLAGFAFRGRSASRWLIVGLALVLWSAAWLTGSRSMILLMIAGGVGLVAAMAPEWVQFNRRSIVVLATMAVITIGLAMVIIPRASGTGPLARLRQSLPLDNPAGAVYEVLWRRDGYGLAAARAIREQPLSGVGAGAFTFLSTYFYRLETGSFIPQDNAQNMWRHALAERGLLLFGGVVVLTVLIARLVSLPAAQVSTVYAWALKAAVIGLGAVLVFGLPIENPAIAITAASLVAWLHAANSDIPANRTLSPHIPRVIWFIAVTAVIADLAAARGELRPAARATRVGDLYAYGFGDIESGPNGVRGRPVIEHGVMAVRATAPRFALRCWARGTTPQRLRVWQGRRLILDEAVPAGIIIERLIDAPSDRPGMLLEFETHAPGIGVGGEFVNR